MAEERISEIGGFWLSQRERSPYWYITWFDTDARQTRRRSTGESDLRQAELKLAEHVTLNAVVQQVAPESTLLSAVLLRYWHEHAKTLASHFVAKAAMGLWTEFWGEALVSDLTVKKQEAFMAWLKAKGFKNAYVSRVIGVGRAALKRAYKRQEITHVPFIFDERDRSDEEKAPRLTKDELRKLVSQAHKSHPHMYLFMMIMLTTLCRPDAALDLCPEQVNLTDGLVDMNPPGRKRTKKGRPVVPMCDSLYPLIAEGPRVFSHPKPETYGPPKQPVNAKGFKRAAVSMPYVNWCGKSIQWGIAERFKAIVIDAGLNPAITAYSLRHTMAKELRARGVPWEEVKGMLGHKLPGVTEVYAEFAPDYLMKSRVAIDAFLTEVCVPLAFHYAGGESDKPE